MDFPDGFKNLDKASTKYGAAQGVWMSPGGGYGGPKQKQIAHSQSQGCETNSKGFSMAGIPVAYVRAAPWDRCINDCRDFRITVTLRRD